MEINMAKYVEIKGNLVYYKRVDCQSCLHRNKPESERTMCAKCWEDNAVGIDFPAWEFGGLSWETPLRVIEGVQN